MDGYGWFGRECEALGVKKANYNRWRRGTKVDAICGPRMICLLEPVPLEANFRARIVDQSRILATIYLNHL